MVSTTPRPLYRRETVPLPTVPEAGWAPGPVWTDAENLGPPRTVDHFRVRYASYVICRSRWPRGLRRGSAATRMLGLRVRIPPLTRMFVCCECCVLSGRGLCYGPIARPEDSYRVWCVWLWSWSLDNETVAHWGLLHHGNKSFGILSSKLHS
jgi:hypothetical protein